ncbi:FAD-dependent oxidoreductase [Candidatus Peregrinibacteria bacterium]|jgi:ferredoxin-NADP reductase|nr:FAD-dependent oxidoreductase [Candidatus Peregrinibacteria bacterium]MBT7736856.1 FAD-dependent oxidoreductase [Candidatus Peregrinibacteria bacterium]
MQAHIFKILEKKELTKDVFELILERPEGFSFEAGQFFTAKIEDITPPCFRGYSIASGPSKANIELCIKVVEGGRGSNWLNSLKKDDNLTGIGPNGKFTLQNSNKDILIVATGTGIAPFKAMLEEHLKDLSQKVHLVFGVRYVEDIFYKDLLEELAEKHPNFTYDITVSRPEESYEGNKGRVTEILQNYGINNQEVYICGLKDMIDSVSEILKSKGLPEEQIHFEKYD